MQYDLIIGIDPAGIGNNGIVIYSNETNNIVFNETFKTKTVLESKNLYKKYFLLIKKHSDNKKILVIVENFFLNSKQLLTNPLATPKIIGALMVLVEDVMNWDFQESEPKNKTKIENGLLPTCTCGGNNETEWIQQCFSNWTAMSCIYSKFERKQMY